MYHPTKVTERLSIAATELGFTPVYHSIPEIDAFEASLQALGRYVYNDLNQVCDMTSVTPDEERWIQNEQALCVCDAAYFLTRYAYLNSGGTGDSDRGMIQRFSFRVPQRIYFDIIGELQLRGHSLEIQILKARQLGMCHHPSTRVVTSNLRWIPIEKVRVGDELISVDEYSPKGRGNARKMRTARVEGVREVHAPAFRLTFEDGRELIATSEHRYLAKVWPGNGRVSGYSATWQTVSQMKVGDEIRYVTSTWKEPDYEDGWFGGLLDGEGSIRQKDRAGTEVCVVQVENEVLSRARAYLDQRGYHYREEIDDRVPETSSKFGSKHVVKLVLGRMDEIFRLIGQTRPARFFRHRWWEGKELPGKKSGIGWSRIVSIESLPSQRMIDLQTSTRTFIAEGLVSHNSIFTELLITHRIIFSYGVNAVIGSADQKQTYLMSQMLFLCYDKLPYWLKPKHTARVEGERGRLMFGGLASGVSFQHGSQKYGVGTGSTPTIYHLSEVALYGDDAEKLIDEGLWKAVHASTHVLGILESTGRSNEGWWAKTWHFSKANYPNCRMYPMFLPWFCGVDIYPMPMDRITHPTPDSWVPHRETRLHATKAALYVASTPLLSKHLIAEQVRSGLRPATDTRPWALPLEQQWYWEWNYEEAKFKGTESKFLQEMASDDEEALQRSTESVFGHETITMIDRARQPSFDCYTISGQSIEDAHVVPEDYFDYTPDASGHLRERIQVAYPSSKGGLVSRWELIPLRPVEMRHDHPEDADRVLCIWEHPLPGYTYSLGGDTSEGKGADSTVASIWRLGNDNFPDVQVAEFASAYVSHVEAFAFYLCLAAYYSIHMREAHAAGLCRWREPYVSIEQLAAVGDTAQHQMGLLGYTNFHRMSRYDSPLVNIRNQKRGTGTRIGWYTGAWSRPILLGSFVHYCRNGWAKVNSPWLLNEMKHFEQHETATGKPKMEAEEGQHDDRVFGAALGTFPPHDMDMMTRRSKKRIDRPLALPNLDLSPYRGNVISGADLIKPTVATLDDLIYSGRGLERYRDA